MDMDSYIGMLLLMELSYILEIKDLLFKQRIIVPLI